MCPLAPASGSTWTRLISTRSRRHRSWSPAERHQLGHAHGQVVYRAGLRRLTQTLQPEAIFDRRQPGVVVVRAVARVDERARVDDESQHVVGAVLALVPRDEQ